MIGEDGHVGRCMECLLNFILRDTLLTHHPVALTLTDRAIEDLLHLSLGQVVRIRCILLVTVLLIESRLEELHHMLVGGILGVFLHAGVDGGIDFQSIGIDAIVLAITLHVFIAPTVQRI